MSVKKVKSLKMRLLRNLLLSLSLVWLATIGLAYDITDQTLNEQHDLQLKEVAAALARSAQENRWGELSGLIGAVRRDAIEIEQAETFVARSGKQIEYQVWQDSKMIISSAHAPKSLLAQQEGFSHSKVENRDWRVFALQRGEAQVMVGEDLQARDALIRAMILSGVWPMLLGIPLIGLTIWLSVTSALKPLAKISNEIASRSPDLITAIDLYEVPSEVAPLILSLNHFFGIVRGAFERERQFTDDAAHELRTPLAAIKAQAQAALRSTDEGERNESLRMVSQGVDRASKMVAHLLTLARLEPGRVDLRFSSVDLRSLLRETMTRCANFALSRDIEIGLEADQEAAILGDREQLDVLFSNLIDNSIRHSPRGAEVDVRIINGPDSVMVRIENTGVVIPPQYSERIFSRFVRLSGNREEGSGIGLAIVKKIVDLHRASIRIFTPPDRPTVVAEVIFAKSNAPTL